MPLLPAGMPTPPSFRKFNPADQPIMFLGLTSETLPMYVARRYAETTVPRAFRWCPAYRRSRSGAQKYAVRVQVDPESCTRQRHRAERSEPALQNWNVNLPTGQLYGPRCRPTTSGAGQLMNAEASGP